MDNSIVYIVEVKMRKGWEEVFSTISAGEALDRFDIEVKTSKSVRDHIIPKYDVRLTVSFGSNE